MKRRDFLFKSGLVAGTAILPWHQLLGAILQEDMAYQMKLLRNGIGYFTERGGTIGYMFDPKGLVVVDTQFPEQAGHLIDEIKKQSKRKLDLLVNTHHHGDHTAGNIAFKGMVEKVVAHKNSKTNQERVAIQRKSEDDQLYPDTLYDETWSSKVGPERLSLTYHGAAHTNGDSVVHFENANVVHMGDLIFNRRHPYIDRGAGASIANWIEVLATVRKKFDGDTLFIFGHAGNGHGVTGGKDDLAAMQNYLDRLLVYARNGVKAGKTLEDLNETEIIPGAPEWKGNGIGRCVTAAYEEVTEKGI
jgi:glyoxylase-like metal-dependent hydrolase (beta-lactamase superfamily II)